MPLGPPAGSILEERGRGGGKEGGREEERDRGKAGGRIGGIERRGWKHISYLFDQTPQLLFKGGVYFFGSLQTSTTTG